MIDHIQVNLAMSNLLISKTRHMSKRSSIPEHFPYIALYFKSVCRTSLSRNLSYIEVVLYSQKLVFCFFTTIYVEVIFVLVIK